MYRLWTPSLPGIWRPQVHEDCAHNLVRGLELRTLGKTPSPEPTGINAFKRSMREISSVVKGRSGLVNASSLAEVVESYRGNRRLYARYTEAFNSLVADGYAHPRDARVKAFVKGEKLAKYKVFKPRVIMGRDPRYNLELASYLRPIEHAFYAHFRGWGRQFYTHTRLVGKGLDPGRRALLIKRKMMSNPGMVAMEIDGMSFESHFSVPILKAEHSVYKSLNRSRRLAQLLDWQLEFDGRGGDVRFHAVGVRASGDYNTGLGNTLVMCGLVLMVAREVKTKFDFLADGDNAIIFVNRKDIDTWTSRINPICIRAGFEMALEQPVFHLEQVPFGQSKPLHVDGVGWTMIRNPMKVLSHAGCGYQHYKDLVGGVRVLKSVAYCEAVLNRGVPVLSKFASILLELTRRVKFSKAELSDFEYKAVLAKGTAWERARTVEVSYQTRLGFETSWGITVEQQLEMEAQLKLPELPSEWCPSRYDPEVPNAATDKYLRYFGCL